MSCSFKAFRSVVIAPLMNAIIVDILDGVPIPSDSYYNRYPLLYDTSCYSHDNVYISHQQTSLTPDIRTVSIKEDLTEQNMLIMCVDFTRVLGIVNAGRST